MDEFDINYTILLSELAGLFRGHAGRKTSPKYGKQETHAEKIQDAKGKDRLHIARTQSLFLVFNITGTRSTR